MTSLMLAASNGHDSVIKLLIAHGADVNAQNTVRISVLPVLWNCTVEYTVHYTGHCTGQWYTDWIKWSS